MRHIIGLVGFQGSGKDTVGRIIREQYPRFHSTSFARPIKDSLCSMFGWNPEMMEGLSEESRAWREAEDVFWSQHLNRPVTPRSMMREFGTELVRNKLDQNFWTLSLRKKLEGSKKSFVITDVRFNNEIQMLRSLGGKIIWVRRDPLPIYYQQALLYNKQSKIIQNISYLFLRNLHGIHRSEREWIGTEFDHTLVNNGSVTDLRHQVIEWMQQHVTTTKA